MSIINPVGFGDDFIAWADQMSFLIQGQVPQFIKVLDEKDTWQEWAMCLVGAQDALGQDSPDPYGFATWQEWAERLFETHEFIA